MSMKRFARLAAVGGAALMMAGATSALAQSQGRVGVVVTNITSTGATVSWVDETNPQDQKVYLKAPDGTQSQQSQTSASPLYVTTGKYLHTANLSSLTPGTEYYYGTSASESLTVNHFRTAPASSEAFTAILFGDYQKGAANGGDDSLLNNLHTSVERLSSDVTLPPFANGFSSPAVYLSTGDIAESAPTDYQSYFLGKPFLRTAPLMATVGNHDYVQLPGWMMFSSAPFTKYFPQSAYMASKRHYYFDYSGVRFIMLDCGGNGAQSCNLQASTGQLTDVQSWLDNVKTGTAAQSIQHVVVVMHMPLYSYCADTPNNRCHAGDHTSPSAQNLLSMLRNNGKVRAVFSGHNHFFQRVAVDGDFIQYFTIGGGGASMSGYVPATSTGEQGVSIVKNYTGGPFFVALRAGGCSMVVNTVAPQASGTLSMVSGAVPYDACFVHVPDPDRELPSN